MPPAASTADHPRGGGAARLEDRVPGFDRHLGANVLVVTGKGGVGKTTAAATLGLAATAAGRATLLVELEGRHSLSRAFATAPWDYQEREFRPGLWGTALDPADAVYEYLELFYGLKHVQWVMERSHALDFATTAAPGLRDLLLVGKVYEIERRRRADGRRRYDTIIVDAPPTGRIVPFLQAPDAVTEIVRVGPIRRQASQIHDMLLDPHRTRVVLVTLLEEMPIVETIEAAEALASAGLTVGPVIANQVEPEVVTRTEANRLERISRATIGEYAAEAGIDLGQDDVDALRRSVADHRGRLGLQAEMSGRLDKVPATRLRLPMMDATTFDTTTLVELADGVAEQLATDGDAADGNA